MRSTKSVANVFASVAGHRAVPRSVRTANPVTPIPARASAYPADVARVRSRYPRLTEELDEGDLTRIPTWPPTAGWQVETPGYAAMRNLPVRAPVLAEAVSDPAYTLEDLESIPTNPPVHLYGLQSQIEALADTPTATDLLPVSASDELPDAPEGPLSYHPLPVFEPLEALRWWLLAPGHLELIFWGLGSAFLFGFTCLFIFMIVLSMGCFA